MTGEESVVRAPEPAPVAGEAAPSEPEAPALEVAVPVQAESVPEVVPEPVPEPIVLVAEPSPMPAPPAPEPSAPSVSVAVPPPAPASEPSQSSQKPRKASSKNRMLEVVRARRAERLEKIVQLAREKRVITNDDVQKLLLVSDSTATRYLNSLVVQVRLRRVGAPGHQHYEPL